jgi:hypothetical protein
MQSEASCAMSADGNLGTHITFHLFTAASLHATPLRMRASSHEVPTANWLQSIKGSAEPALPMHL